MTGVQTCALPIWPLFCTILNLPPSVRTKVGAGMFMLTAFYGKLDSATEEFIFNDCLIAELKILYKGLLVEVAGRQYFMQVIVFNATTSLLCKDFTFAMYLGAVHRSCLGHEGFRKAAEMPRSWFLQWLSTV